MKQETHKTKEAIPAALVEYYRQEGDIWVPDVDGMEPAARVSEFRNTSVTLKKLLAKFPGVNADDPSTVEKAVEEFTDLKSREDEIRDAKLVKAGKVDEVVEERMGKAKKEWATKEATYTETISGLNSQLANEIIDRQIVDEATKLGVKPAAIQDVKLRGRSVFKMKNGQTIALDDRGEQAYGKDGKALTITEFISDLATTDKGKHLFEASTGTKSGDRVDGKAHGGINPWKKETWSLLRQGDIFRENKELAKQLAAEAGKPLPDNI